MSTSAPGTTEDRLTCVHFLRECRLERGGVTTAVLDLCAVLAARGHRVILLTCGPADVPDSWRLQSPDYPLAVELERSRFSRSLLSRRGLGEAKHLLDQADVVHFHTLWGLSNLQLARLVRAAHLPYAVTLHGMLDDWCMQQKSLKKRTFLAAAGRRFLESAARLQFTAESEMDQAVRWIPAARSRCSVVPCIVDLSRFQELPGPGPALAKFPVIERGKPTLLFLSRVHPKKGVEFLIEAAAILKNEAALFQLLIAGPGESRYLEGLQRLVAKHAMSDRVHFLGMVRGEEKMSLFQLADVFVLPTHQENFGLVLVEALACGTPVVTTQGTDIWQELEAAGARVSPRTATAIADAVRALMSDPGRGRELGRKGRAHVFHWLGRDHVARQYEQLYADAIRNGPSA